MTDLIVDANSLYARSWYATNRPGAKIDAYGCLVATLQMSIMCLNPRRVGEKIDRTLFCWDAGQKKAKERREQAIRYWKYHVWPHIKKGRSAWSPFGLPG